MIRSVRALLLFLAFVAPGWADEAKPMGSIFLVARADLPDRNFNKTVVLLTREAGPVPSA